MTTRPRHALRELLICLLAVSGGLVILLITIWPPVESGAVVPLTIIVVTGLFLGGSVGFLTGIRGPHWGIYAAIVLQIVVFLLLQEPWNIFAIACIPVNALSYIAGRALAFFGTEREPSDTWTIGGRSIENSELAKSAAISKFHNWDSLDNGRFIVTSGHLRFEAWGSPGEGYIVHAATNDNYIETLHVLSRSSHQDDEVSVALNSHGLTAWIPSRLRAPADVAERALEAFMETQTAAEVPGWRWEAGDLAQDMRFMD